MIFFLVINRAAPDSGIRDMLAAGLTMPSGIAG